VNAPRRLGQVTPAPTPVEAAAIVAALERFTREHAASALPRAVTGGGWLRAARLEAVGRAPGPAADPLDWQPWGERSRAHPAKH
jgi:hypothetical protein